MRAFLSGTPPAVPSAIVEAPSNTALNAVVAPLIATLPPAKLAARKARFATNSQVPAEQDRALLPTGRAFHGQTTLIAAERVALRGVFGRLVLAT